MGFNSVYRALQDVFPQVDTRLLRAVAIEHSKDADVAVEAVLVEVIPYLSERSTALCSSNENEVLLDSSRAVGDANNAAPTNDASLADSTHLGEALNGSSHYDVNSEHGQVQGHNGKEDLISLVDCEESSVKAGPNTSFHVSSTILIHDNDNGAKIDHDLECGNTETESEEIILVGKYHESSVNVGSDQSPHKSITSSDGLSANDSNMSICGGNHVEDSVVDLASPPVEELIPSASENSLQLVVVPEQPEPIVSVDGPTKNSSVSETADLEDESSLNTIVTRSGQICRIDFLEEIIADARSNKKTLFLAMESVLRLMREVEVQEKAAEQAREEAAMGGLDILTRVADLKQMLSHAKEANDMHAGEVYGEKAILATEVKEIQSRLLGLSDERGKSLAILEEMRRTLEARVAAAEKEREAAEKERLQKEESALNALADRQLIMEKIAQESKILKQEAEENFKLQEFLIDRGRIVDMLQGEISVICQDVRLLKEKIDERVPLSKSISSSQTSRMLASSSSSSLKSIKPDQVLEQADPSEASERTSSSSASIDDQLLSGEERTRYDHNLLVDDGWDFFDIP